MALAAIERLGANSPASILASDTHLLRWFACELVMPSANRPDATCAGRHTIIAEDPATGEFIVEVGADSSESGTRRHSSCVLAEHGFKVGSGGDGAIHRWSFVCEKAGQFSWVGVSERPPENLDEWLAFQVTGFGVSGTTRGGVHDAFGRKGRVKEKALEQFAEGDTVRLELDCAAAVLRYFVNGTLVRDLTFQGALRDLVLFPAFSSNYSLSRFRITFID
jgi:hypothetical protein